MKEEYKFFKKISIREFNFLITDYNFSLSQAVEDRYECNIIYKNFTTGIEISFKPREGGVIIFLYRLIDNEIPKYEIFIKPDTILNSFDFDDLIELRSSDFSIDQESIDLFNFETLENVIKQYAFTLKNIADDILTGDFRSFKQLDKIVKKRALDINNTSK